MARIGFLHTANVHVATFTALLAAADPTTVGTHVVDETLLADARRSGGVDDELRHRLRDQLRLAAMGNDAVLCTCSSIAGAAEGLAAEVGLPVVRIDRPLARVAVATATATATAGIVATAGIIAVVAAVESTMVPTRELLLEEARLQKVDVTLIDRPCPETWALFETGDIDAYLGAIAQHVDSIADAADVVVLAQASMAPAAGLCRTSTPVLSSPVLGIEAALKVASAGAALESTLSAGAGVWRSGNGRLLQRCLPTRERSTALEHCLPTRERSTALEHCLPTRERSTAT